jgi:hypothetical protein
MTAPSTLASPQTNLARNCRNRSYMPFVLGAAACSYIFMGNWLAFSKTSTMFQRTPIRTCQQWTILTCGNVFCLKWGVAAPCYARVPITHAAA